MLNAERLPTENLCINIATTQDINHESLSLSAQ